METLCIEPATAHDTASANTTEGVVTRAFTFKERLVY